MARFLFTVWPLTGHIYPNLSLAVALRRRGHAVAFYTGAQMRAQVERQGCEHLPFTAVDEAAFLDLMAEGYQVGNPVQRARRQKALYRTWMVETLPGQLADLTPILERWQPDAIVCDPTLWAPILFLHEKQGIPVAVFSYTMGCLLAGPDTPPFGPGLPRPRHWGHRLVNAGYRGVVERFTADSRRRVNAIRRAQGLPPITRTVTEHAGTMPLYLVTSVPELDYQRTSLPPHVHYIGPCSWSNGVAGPPPQWMESLSADQPWVHVTEGTIHHHAPLLLSAAVQGLGAAAMQVIIATGTHRNPDELGLGPLATNTRVEAWVPYDHLLPRTAVVVTTGGAGTVMAALQAGVPLVVVPTEWDKPENAQRVVECGAGLRLDPGQCTPARLRAAVEQVLYTPTFRHNAQHMADCFRSSGGAVQAAALLEELL
jgi:MGT family glycosyltransferase